MTTCHIFRRCELLVLLGVAACLGCGPSSSQHTVRGKVMINGVLVERGEINLAPVDDAGAMASAPIINGDYTLTSTPGAKRVQIQAYEQQGSKPIDPAMPGSATVPVLKPLLPEKYNSATELTMDVDGDIEQNFEITLP